MRLCLGFDFWNKRVCIKQRKLKLPIDIDYQKINTISKEGREKLSAIKPNDFGHASDLPGVSKADLIALMIWLKLKDRKTTTKFRFIQIFKKRMKMIFIDVK